MNCILLHGWGASNTIWQGFTDQLTTFDKVTAPCLYKIANEIKSNKLESIAAELSNKIDSDSIIIAWSISGLIATHIAKLSNKIKAIIFIASTPCFVNKENWLNVIDEARLEDLQNKLSKDTTKALEYFSGLVAYGDDSTKKTNKFIRNNLAEEKDKATLSSWLIQMQQIDQRKEFTKIEVPTQIILGENDSLINVKIRKQLNPSFQVDVIKNCGHAPFVSKTNETIKIIERFVNAKFN